MTASALAGSLTETPAQCGGPSVASGFLDHFRLLVVAMDAFEENLEAPVEARHWSPLAFDVHYSRALASGARDDYAALSPISRRAFDAVAAALNALAGAVLTLYDAAPDSFTQEDLAARQAITAQFHGLLDRASALIDAREGARGAVARPQVGN